MNLCRVKFFLNRWVLLAFLSLVWGSSFILIKKSILYFTPFQVGAVRICLAGIVFMAYGIPVLRKLPKKVVKWMVVAGLCGSFFPMFMFPLAQTEVSSSMAGVLNALMPIFALIVGFLLFGVKSGWSQGIGAFVGFSGAAILLFTSGEIGVGNFGYALIAVVAALLYAISSLLIQLRLKEVNSLKLSVGIFTLLLPAGLVCLWLSGFFSDFRGTADQWVGLGYVSVLSLVGTALAAGLFFRLIQSSSAVFAGTVTYLMPLVAAFWGILDGERITAWFFLAMSMIFLGIYLIRERTSKGTRPFDAPHVPR